jgi:hypothetical protein
VLASINEAESRNNWEVEMPWVMGLIGTRSVSKQILAFTTSRKTARILRGITAVNALEALRADRTIRRRSFEAYKTDLGFGLLLKKYVEDVNQATPAIIDKAVNDTVPRVTPMFWGSGSWSPLALPCSCCSAWPSGAPCSRPAHAAAGCCVGPLHAACALDCLRAGLVRR